MREIKFRAWDKTARLWLAGWKIYQSGTPSEVGGVVYMQYTGLKDKNGVEIYEGDIISPVTTGDKYQVVYDADKAAFHCWGCTGYLGSWMSTFTLGFEVIGNIYENPELLAEGGV